MAFAPPGREKKDDEPRLNSEITAREVRLIDAEGNQVGIVSRYEALRMAEEAELDLVEISPQAQPPVCKIMDFGKFRYQQQKKASEAKKKQKVIEVKEVKFRPGTEEADYQVKMRNVVRFLEEGNKAKITLRFRGREMAHQDIGMQMYDRIEKDLGDLAIVEQRPKLEGRQMVMVVAPRKH
ncbi:MAG: translation initiation factor IF-3 [Halothiobacillaceae bacterium]|uniref:translation initiation factor IF-3 n=1 Tax=Thiofaba sp. EF100 TaxID=3121274 RepID=UPI00322159C4